MTWFLKNKRITILILIWYIGGIIGFSIPILRPVFQILTPFGMVATTALLLWFHEKPDTKFWLAFSGIVLISFFAEMIGVNTQRLFGDYQYGLALGSKILNTPLCIGLNWFVLVYCISCVFYRLSRRWFFPIVGSAIMVAFDWLMEPGAIASGMWQWSQGSIPLKNYFDWFLVSLFLFLLTRILKVEFKNPVASLVFAMQIVFFLGLNIFTRIL